ncbi:unnamed protein product, partial [Closterium sp. NIES-53]
AAFHDGVTDDCDVVAAAFRDRVTDDGGDAAHPSTADHNHHYPGRERLDDLQPPLIYRRGQAHPVADRSQPFDGGIDDAPLNHALVNDGADAVGVKGSPRDDAAASPDRTLMRSAPPCSGEDSAGTNSAGADSGESDSAGAERAEAECAGFDVAHQPCAREMAFELRRSAVRSSSDSRGTAARAWRGSGYFSVLPDNLCGKIASFIVHAKSLVAFRSTCSYLRYLRMGAFMSATLSTSGSPSTATGALVPFAPSPFASHTHPFPWTPPPLLPLLNSPRVCGWAGRWCIWRRTPLTGRQQTR